MKNKNSKYLLLFTQFIISLLFGGLAIYAFSISYNSGNALYKNMFIYLPILIQEIFYALMSYQLYQLPEMNKEIDNKLLHLNLLLLSFDGIIILALSSQQITLNIISPLIVGKIHLFCSLSSMLLFLLGGIYSNEVGSTKYKINTAFMLVLSAFIVNFQEIPSPTAAEYFYPIVPSNEFITLLIIISLLAIISYTPSYWKDRSFHNLVRIIAFGIMILSATILRNYYTLPLTIIFIAIVLLISSIIMYVINIKSYTI
ncbi:MAG: hypothetical protein M0P10_08510 [Sphaerochaetaceae bacterium]|nr:hypothetical protein [Sphaerochaetaceae bacterium]